LLLVRDTCAPPVGAAALSVTDADELEPDATEFDGALTAFTAVAPEPDGGGGVVPPPPGDAVTGAEVVVPPQPTMIAMTKAINSNEIVRSAWDSAR
jgi:hypothetical protein